MSVTIELEEVGDVDIVSDFLAVEFLVLTVVADSGMVKIRLADIHAVTWIGDQPLTIYSTSLVVKVVDPEGTISSEIRDVLDRGRAL